jgi:hypothetical protein
VSGEISGVFGNLSGVSGEMFGISDEEALQSNLSGGKRVHFADSLLIPQNELNMARTSILEFAEIFPRKMSRTVRRVMRNKIS